VTTTSTWTAELSAALGQQNVLPDPDVTAASTRDQAMLAEAGTPAAVRRATPSTARSLRDAVAVTVLAGQA
jgi:hypothetical protein